MRIFLLEDKQVVTNLLSNAFKYTRDRNPTLTARMSIA